MRHNESVDSYIARVRNIASKSASLGQKISDREIVYHIVRGLSAKYENVAAVLRPQRNATLDDIYQALREEERILPKVNTGRNNLMLEDDKAYRLKAHPPKRGINWE